MMKTKKNKLKIMISAYALVFIVLFVIIYVVPRVSNIFMETYTAQYGILEQSTESSYIAVRTEKLYTSDNGGQVKRAVSQGALMRRNAHIADVGAVRYYSQERGIISYYYDGLESVFTPQNMQELTESNLDLNDKDKSYELKECESGNAQSGSPIFKVVDNTQWYIVCWVNADEADDWTPGKSVTVEFDKDDKIKMKVSQCNMQGEKLQLILSCNRYYEKFDRIRTGECRLIKASRSGIIIDSESITEEDGTAGVYVMSKKLDEATFVPVKILLSDGEKTVVEKNYFMDENGEKVTTIENYDEILKKPKDSEKKKGSEKNVD